MIRVGSYNLFDFGDGNAHRDPQVDVREQRLFDVIRCLDVDVLAVQEVKGSTPALAANRLRRLADAVNMDCQVRPSLVDEIAPVAVAAAPTGFNVALMWRPGITPIAGA